MRTQRNLLVSGILLVSIFVTSAWILLLGGFEARVVLAAGTHEISAEPAQEIQAGSTVTYVHTITNPITPPGTLSFTVTLGNSANFTSTVDPMTFTLGNTSRDITVTVEAPPDAVVGTTNYTTVTVSVSKEGVAPVEAVDTTTVAAPKVVTITPASDTEQGTPGGSVMYVHEIENEMTQQVTVDISLSDSTGGFNSSASASQFVLDPGEIDTLTVTVTIPSNALNTDVNTTTVTVTPQSGPAPPVSAEDVTTVAKVWGVSILPNDSGSALPGNAVIYNHTVTNEGNSTETFLVLTPDSDQSWNVDRNPTSLTLDASESDTLQITVNIPSNAEGGTVDHTEITVQAQANSAITDSVFLTTTATAVPGVLVGPNNEQGADAGDTITFQHTITNTGNKRETFTIAAVSASGWTATPSENEVTLNKNATTSINVEVQVPISACSLDDVTTVTVTGPGAVDTATDTIHVSNCLNFLPLISKPRSWHQVGSGWSSADRASSVAVCPSNDSILLAGTDTGKVLRLNGGVWQAQSLPGAPGVGDVRDLVIDHSTCNTAYAGIYVSPSSGGAIGGVWRGTRSVATGNWTWSQLGTASGSGGRIRALAFSDGILFAGNEQTGGSQSMGLSYWNGATWVTAVSDRIVMDLYVSNPVSQSGPVYAAMWQQTKVWANFNPGGAPGSWSQLVQLANLPGNGSILAVYGNATTVQQVGMLNEHYRQVGNSWQLVDNVRTRTFAGDGSLIYVGYDSSRGVSASTDGGATFLPINLGFGPVPQTIFKMAQDTNELYAATSTGVWSRVKGP